MLQGCLPLSESLQKRSLYWDFQALLSYSLLRLSANSKSCCGVCWVFLISPCSKIISPPLSSLSKSFSHSLTGSVPEAVLKNLAGRIFSESFMRTLYHIWYNVSTSMLQLQLHMNRAVAR